MKPDLGQYGFKYQDSLIMAYIGGSEAHGAKVGATDDTDWYGRYIPPAVKMLGLQREEHFVFKGQKNIHRAELEQLHGYDTKHAMHVIRLYGEAKELMETGKISLPWPNRDELIEIQKGKYRLSEIREMGRQLEVAALAAAERSPLPEEAVRSAIRELITSEQLRFWEGNAV